MTIPIQPGPFSFLAPLGQALGNYAQQREQNRQQRLAEAKDQAHNYLAMRAAGLMKPKDFEDPNIQAVFHAAGYGPISPEELPQEIERRGQTLGYQQLITGQPLTASPEARIAFGLPQQGQGEAQVAQNLAAVPQAQVAQRTAEAQQAGAGLTGSLSQLGAQQEPIEKTTDDFVYSMATQGGGIPKDGAAAYQRALADPRMAQTAQQIGQAPFDAAVERLRQKWYGLSTSREAANARMAGASGVGVDDIARIYQNQQARITAQINSMRKPTDDDYTYAGAAASVRARGKTPLPIMTQAEQRVSAYNSKVDSLNTELEGYRNMLGNSAALQQIMGPQGQIIAPPPQPTPGIPHPAGGPSGVAQRRAAAADTAGVRKQRQADWDALAQQFGKERTTQEVGPRPK